MPRRYSTREVAGTLERLGFRFVRQVGSHMRFRGNWRGQERNVSVIANVRQIRPKTLASIIEQAGLTPGEFRDLVERKEVKE